VYSGGGCATLLHIKVGGKKMNILVCDDERDIVEALTIYLSSEGYEVFKAYNGEEALDIIDKEDIHLVLLDVMMPVMDGITAMSKIREKSNIPIIMLTAKSQDTDKVLGLNVGADDYVTKPFNPVELIARVKSQLRRYMTLGSRSGSVNDGNVIVRAGIELDDDAKTVTVDGEPVSLTPTEFQILKLFMENPGKVFSPKDIYRQVWRDAPLGAEGTVAVHIRHLREKVEINPSEPRYLKVVWGQGYKLCSDYEVG
jgi:DNA-binding response OmpR family regulator